MFAFGYDKAIVGLVDGDEVYLVGIAVPVVADDAVNSRLDILLAGKAFEDVDIEKSYRSIVRYD